MYRLNSCIRYKVVEQETLSDHRYIVTKITEIKTKRKIKNGNNHSSNQYSKPDIPTFVEKQVKWKWNKANLDLFSALLIGYEWTTLEDEDPDAAARNIKRVISNICKQAIPKEANRNNRIKRKTYWWNEKLGIIHAECNRLRRIYMRAKRNNADIYEQHFENWKIKQKEYRSEIKTAKKTSWKEVLEALDEDPWGKGYKIVLKKINSSLGNLTQRLDNTELNKILNGLFPITETTQSTQQNKNNSKKLPLIRQGPRLRMQELEIAIKKIAKKNPAPGPDGITSKMLKHINGLIPNKLNNVFNECLISGIFPIEWRKSRLVLLKKEGKPDGEASSYRPICLTEEVTKLYERIINKRITEHLNTQERQIAELQYGFRIGRSTTDAIIAVKERINSIKRRGNYAIAISIDIKNAFNSIKWNIVERATKEINLPYYLQKIISEYLRGGEILYQDRSGSIKRRKTFCGVPQGSVLGPTL